MPFNDKIYVFRLDKTYTKSDECGMPNLNSIDIRTTNPGTHNPKISYKKYSNFSIYIFFLLFFIKTNNFTYSSN